MNALPCPHCRRVHPDPAALARKADEIKCALEREYPGLVISVLVTHRKSFNRGRFCGPFHLASSINEGPLLAAILLRLAEQLSEVPRPLHPHQVN